VEWEGKDGGELVREGEWSGMGREERWRVSEGGRGRVE
jgi:hypothetical protein